MASRDSRSPETPPQELNRLELLQALAAILRGDAEVGGLACFREEDGLRSLAWVASEQLVSPALYPALVRNGQLDFVRPDFRAYLQSLYELNVRRNERLVAQAHELWDALAARDIGPIALKGLAGLVGELYPQPGERLMQDIDLLVVESRLPVARAALVALGYRPTPAPGATEADYDRTQQQAPLIHPARYLMRGVGLS